MFKLALYFFGGYSPDPSKLLDRNVKKVNINVRQFINAQNSNQGYGRIEGTTKKLGQKYSPVTVCCFKRSTRQLLWETVSKPDGTYSFRNIAVGLECFVVAFDPNQEYNAVISDKLVAK